MRGVQRAHVTTLFPSPSNVKKKERKRKREIERKEIEIESCVLVQHG